MRLKVVLVLLLLLPGAGVLAADPQPYTVRIEPTGNAALDSILTASSQLVSLRTSAPAGPFALIGRAQADIERLRTALESFGYYRGTVSVSIDGRGLDEPGLPEALESMPKSPGAKVQVSIETGPLFHLREVKIDGDVNEAARAAFGLQSGAPAVASQVLAAGQRLLDTLQEQGHAFAKVDDPIAYEDASEPLLDVSFKVDAGPVYVLGAIRFEGLKHLKESFLRRRLLLHPGQPYSPSQVEKARTDLLALGVFSSITVQLPKQEDVKDGQLPLVVQIQERRRHTVTLNAAYSSDLGGSGGATWGDRDLLGNAEQLNLSASLINWGGSDTTTTGYDLGAQLIKPDFRQRDQSLQFGIVALKQDLQAYDQTATTASATLTRKLSSTWSASMAISVEEERILQECESRYYTLFSIPLSAKYDSTALASPLDDPLHGARVALSVAPTESLGHGPPTEISSSGSLCPAPSTATGSGRSTSGSTAAVGLGHATFFILQANASTYFDLARLDWTRPGRSVLALRALAAEAHGASEFSLPPDQRFYGGGSTTVRGYRYQSIGPQFPNSNPADAIPIGGTALAAAGIELRQRIGRDYGMALFIDGGEVSALPRPLDGTLRFGYGAGVRYYTPIGPIRVDLALPLHRLPGGQPFEIYVGLGQSF